MSNVVELRPAAVPCAEPVGLAESANHYGGYEPFVDEHVIGSFLGIAPRRVLEMARKGEFPSHPIGRTRKTWRFRISEIAAHVGAVTNYRHARIAPAVPATHERKRNG
jgi:hypothetical protein